MSCRRRRRKEWCGHLHVSMSEYAQKRNEGWLLRTKTYVGLVEGIQELLRLEILLLTQRNLNLESWSWRVVAVTAERQQK